MDVILKITVAGLFLLGLFLAVVAGSLQGFLRSRLAQVGRLRRNEKRFGEILKDDELALQACRLAFVAAIVPACALSARLRYLGVSESSASESIWIDLAGGVVLGWLLYVVVPWTVTRVAAEHVLFDCWPVIRLITAIFRPLVGVSRAIDTLVHRIAGRRDPEPENLETFAEEIQSVVDEGEREGILESRAGKMIQRVMELRQEDVRAVMTPRMDILTIQADCGLPEARRQLIELGHSRIPVIEETTDDIIGILYARDLLESLEPEHSSKTLREIVRPAYYVPETTTIHSLLDTMKRERLHMAIVLDEYGGVTGLVTLEDILEEIVGDISDEFDETEPDLYSFIDAHTLSVDARMHLDELNDLFDLNFPEDRDFDTIGGFVFSELGRVPKPGETVAFGHLRITVAEATERKIVRLEIHNTLPWPDFQGDHRQSEDGHPRALPR